MQTTRRKPKRQDRPLPKDPMHRGRRLLEQGDKLGAVAAFMQASEAKPHDAGIHIQISILLGELQNFDGAIGAAMTAVDLAPTSHLAHNAMTCALLGAGRAEAALPHCANAVMLAPKDPSAILNLGAALFSLGRFQDALAVGLQAVTAAPRSFEAQCNFALALEALGRLDEAEAQSRQALSLRPDDSKARHNLAALLLSQGQLDAESWSLYESRLGLTPQARAITAFPRWAGEDVTGRTILLHAEQGFGDTIQFARFAPLVAERGARVIMAVQAPLVRLLQGLDSVDEVIAAGAPLPAFDVFCPLASLPGIFKTTLESIPGRLPYLAATAESLARFSRGREGLQVGLCWAGNPGFIHDRLRSIPASLMLNLRDCPGIAFHSLQKGAPLVFPMQDRMADVTDFADTAAIIAGLDLVIAVDTAVAHLAAAMGKEVWLLSRKMGCWRWLRNRTDSPWYPTIRIVRQSRENDWADVIAEVRDALLLRTLSLNRRRPAAPDHELHPGLIGRDLDIFETGILHQAGNVIARPGLATISNCP